eukprot:TRINITY_DN7507_c0_g1_i2.p1 TRINITY_DN7507_c0_g1~~TRINITY_DN7507_c0_g1_i2.p1  ORF type:complete len:499 (-),score=55.43 TRINITY_DN7507_c0_g1_i2:70-1566(-)
MERLWGLVGDRSSKGKHSGDHPAAPVVIPAEDDDGGEDWAVLQGGESDEQRGSSGRSTLTFSNMVAMVEQNEMESYDEFRNEIERTNVIHNLPYQVRAQTLVELGSRNVRGGVRNVKFYPKGRAKSALVEFNTHTEGVSKKFAASLISLSPSVTIAPAQICIRQAILTELEVERSKLAARDREVGEKDARIEQLEARGEQLLNRSQEAEALAARNRNSYESENRLRRGLDERVAVLTGEAEEMRGMIRNMQEEMHAMKRQFVLAQLKNVLTKELGREVSEVADALISAGDYDNYIQTNRSELNLLRKDLEVIALEERREKALYRGECIRQERLDANKARYLEYARYCIEHWREWAKRQHALKMEEELTRQFLLEEQQARQREAESKEYSCPICFCDYRIEEMYTLDNCFHRFCFSCLGEYLNVKIKDADVRVIKCPDPACKEEISPSEIKHCVDKSIYAKYEEFSLNSALTLMPDVRFCPKANCKNAMVNICTVSPRS